jgi:catechol 2,3-dioxygenase-like lactoylglutathione lyase family enzyme
MSNTLGGAQPILPVADLRASIDYYVNALGFQHDWGDAGFASVSRDRCHLFLCENDPGAHGNVGVDRRRGRRFLRRRIARPPATLKPGSMALYVHAAGAFVSDQS